MTAQVEFFCSPEEERDVIRYVLNSADIAVFDVRERMLTSWEAFSADQLPNWQERLSIFLWNSTHGPLVWHEAPPEVSGPTHGRFVANLFAREEWARRGLQDGDRLLDIDLSPILAYRRGTVRNGKRGPNRLLAQPSSLQRIGVEYERWVKRVLAWVRRRAKLVHDWRKPSALPNSDMLLNSTYAFPDVQGDIASGEHHFALFVDDTA